MSSKLWFHLSRKTAKPNAATESGGRVKLLTYSPSKNSAISALQLEFRVESFKLDTFEKFHREKFIKSKKQKGSYSAEPIFSTAKMSSNFDAAVCNPPLFLKSRKEPPQNERVSIAFRP